MQSGIWSKTPNNVADELLLKTVHSLAEVNPSAWDKLGGDDNPFLSHAFLYGMEEHHAVGADFGWYPRYFLIENLFGKLIGACPTYIKTNSYGELVFDWSWASAYKRAGLRYYPKLVCAIPYTPVCGSRLLTYPAHPQAAAIRDTLFDATLAFAEEHNLSGVHWLFPQQRDINYLAHKDGLSARVDCQYHWRNQRYVDFDHFLSTLTSSRRKKIRAERRKVREAGFNFRRVYGEDISDDEWTIVHQLYQDTFDKKAGIPTLSRDFFAHVGRALKRRFMVVFAEREAQILACAIYFRDHNSLYGRYWGTRIEADGLHFETCFYQGLDYCIQHNLEFFEPGAQGEHKIWRGFVPTPTHSFHWLREKSFAKAIDDYCEQERSMMHRQCDELRQHLPYREDQIPELTHQYLP